MVTLINTHENIAEIQPPLNTTIIPLHNGRLSLFFVREMFYFLYLRERLIKVTQ